MKFRLILFSGAFILSAWARAMAAPPAEQLMNAAFQQAAAEKKNVFLMFSTTGCAWCKALKTFLESEEIKPLFTKYFISVQLTQSADANTNPGVEKYEAKYGPIEGRPYHVFLTPDGKEIVDSKANGDGDNIGFPTAPGEIAWFMTMLKKSAPSITVRELALIETKVKDFKLP